MENQNTYFFLINLRQCERAVTIFFRLSYCSSFQFLYGLDVFWFFVVHCMWCQKHIIIISNINIAFAPINMINKNNMNKVIDIW